MIFKSDHSIVNSGNLQHKCTQNHHHNQVFSSSFLSLLYYVYVNNQSPIMLRIVNGFFQRTMYLDASWTAQLSVLTALWSLLTRDKWECSVTFALETYLKYAVKGFAIGKGIGITQLTNMNKMPAIPLECPHCCLKTPGLDEPPLYL